MIDRVLRAGMDVVERTFDDLAEAYAVPIAAFHWVLDDPVTSARKPCASTSKAMAIRTA